MQHLFRTFVSALLLPLVWFSAFGWSVLASSSRGWSAVDEGQGRSSGGLSLTTPSFDSDGVAAALRSCQLVAQQPNPGRMADWYSAEVFLAHEDCKDFRVFVLTAMFDQVRDIPAAEEFLHALWRQNARELAANFDFVELVFPHVRDVGSEYHGTLPSEYQHDKRLMGSLCKRRPKLLSSLGNHMLTVEFLAEVVTAANWRDVWKVLQDNGRGRALATTVPGLVNEGVAVAEVFLPFLSSEDDQRDFFRGYKFRRSEWGGKCDDPALASFLLERNLTSGARKPGILELFVLVAYSCRPGLSTSARSTSINKTNDCSVEPHLPSGSWLTEKALMELLRERNYPAASDKLIRSVSNNFCRTNKAFFERLLEDSDADSDEEDYALEAAIMRVLRDAAVVRALVAAGILTDARFLFDFVSFTIAPGGGNIQTDRVLQDVIRDFVEHASVPVNFATVEDDPVKALRLFRARRLVINLLPSTHAFGIEELDDEEAELASGLLRSVEDDESICHALRNKANAGKSFRQYPRSGWICKEAGDKTIATFSLDILYIVQTTCRDLLPPMLPREFRQPGRRACPAVELQPGVAQDVPNHGFEAYRSLRS